MRNVVNYLESKKKPNSVDMVKRALDNLDLEIDPAMVIVVSGTNGKGSTCATLQTLLMASGKNVGFLSSPHLIKINERIKFNGEDISDEDFCEIFNIVHAKVQDFDLSYFEYIMLIAAHYFFRTKSVDFAILEIGLGGTFDAVNAVPHKLSVITKLGIDHESILGNSPLKIAENKFGIISNNNYVFHTKFDNENVVQLFEKTVKKLQATAVEAYPYVCHVKRSNRYPSFYIEMSLGNFRMNLQGERAAENTALAITVFDHLVNNAGQFLPAIDKVMWPGRMERVTYRNHDVFLSGDHNPQGIQSLLDLLKFYNFENAHFVVGICRDKKYGEMLEKLLHSKSAKLYLTETPEKTLHIDEYDECFLYAAEFISADPVEALNIAIDHAFRSEASGLTFRQLVIVTGSLYLVGKIKAIITAQLYDRAANSIDIF
ncbi:MAG: hypothetical protein LBS14_01030 [Holosporaceae bacterium]|jgi:dihydrofolate synthase/folylpolyglutamate synthase|nr:hypothetical protein [Holosporaceae bacterium]